VFATRLLKTQCVNLHLHPEIIFTDKNVLKASYVDFLFFCSHILQLFLKQVKCPEVTKLIYLVPVSPLSTHSLLSLSTFLPVNMTPGCPNLPF